MPVTVRVSQGIDVELAEVISLAVREERFEPPQLPHVALDVLKVAQDPEASMRRLGSICARDPVLAARVLKLANSSAFPGPPVAALPQAMIRIGVSALKQVLYLYAFAGKNARTHPHREVLEEYWLHSVASALAADSIARARHQDVHLPFLAGLIHDIGRPVALNLCVEMAKTHPLMQKADVTTRRRLVEGLHARLGGLIVARWQLPLALRDACAFHHDALVYRGEHRDLVLTLAAADAIVLRAGIGGAPEVAFGTGIKVFQELQLSRGVIEDTLRLVHERAAVLVEGMTT